MLVFTIKI